MTPEAFRGDLVALGLSQIGAAKFLDVDARTVRRWATGDIPIPRSVELLFGLMGRFRVAPDDC